MDGIPLAALGDNVSADCERRAKQRQSPKRSEGDNSSPLADCNRPKAWAGSALTFALMSHLHLRQVQVLRVAAKQHLPAHIPAARSGTVRHYALRVPVSFPVRCNILLSEPSAIR
jgi:hypothetical protein